jgi:putative transposase
MTSLQQANGPLSFPKVPTERDMAPHLDDLRAAERKGAGEGPDASAAIMDFRSIKTTEECGKLNGAEAHSNGYDTHKNIKGRKRQLPVDTLGLPLSIYVTPANVQDRVGARLLLARLKPLVACLKKIWADGA